MMMLLFINFVFWLITGAFALSVITASILIVYLLYALIRGDD